MANDKNNETSNDKKEIDKLTGIETTGHDWDGLKELNNPLPRWWLWVFYACVVWSIGYWIVYPAWPTLSGATKGIWNQDQYTELKVSQNEIIDRQKIYLDKFEKASFKEILKDPELYAFAIAGGSSAFKDNCATCHGTGASGGLGYPNLNDDDWLWGGTLSDIHQTIQYGVRSGNEDAHISQMPAFGKEKTLNKDEIKEVVEFVLSLSEKETTSSNEKGAIIFKENCATCHGSEGKGNRKVGAPNLTDKIWLYGGSEKDVYKTVYYAHAGIMPAWIDRLDENTIKQLTVYLHQLGGGEIELDENTESSTAK